jgi:NAD(P)H dehydrogenase (quinone)
MPPDPRRRSRGRRTRPAWDTLDACDAMIFGSPTYMGSASAAFKAFMEATSQRWMEQRWAMKLAAGFTNSGSQNGDKQNTLMQFVTLAAQHGMLWVNLNQMPGNNSTAGSENDMNRLGASLGAMAQSNVDAGPGCRARRRGPRHRARLRRTRGGLRAKRWECLNSRGAHPRQRENPTP